MRHSLLVSCVVVAACTGEIAAPTSPTAPGGICAVKAPATKLVRLTHAQFDNTVHDLLGLTDSPSSMFQTDPTFQGFNNNAEGLLIVDRLGRDYRRAAEDLAVKVVTTPAAKAKVVGCTQQTDDCAKDFIAAFGRRAYRRPLTTEENEKLFTLFKAGATLVDGSASSFDKGVQVTVEAMLQSPNFLYRVEVSDGQLYTSHEMAAKLSYLLWNTMPDPILMNLADGDALQTAEAVKEQAIRLLADPRAQSVVDDFHSQWLELARYDNLTRDPTRFPNFNAAMSPMMKEETLRFIRSIVLDERAPFSTVYTANYTFVNAELAKLYGLQGTISGWQRVTLDGTQRQGLLTQTGFLASHAYARTDSPIHRGVFVLRRVLGLPQADPPPGTDFTLPPTSATVRTTREQVTMKTEPAGCAVCHVRINGIGFGFGHYDAVGQFRTQENGVDVDTTGNVNLGGVDVPFTNAVELSTAISTSEEARTAYAVNWLRFAYQRADTVADRCDVDAMATQLGNPSSSVADMIVGLTQTQSFRTRPAEAP